MLIGSYVHNLDPKGRVFIPAKWREDLGATVILTLGLTGAGTGCLYGMSQPEWELFSARLAEIPLTDTAGQALRRRLYAIAAACETDKQGRILLPQQLRTAAGLGQQMTLIGVGNRMEIWNPDELSRHMEETNASYGSILSHLQERGI